jgi:hypothetical protein
MIYFGRAVAQAVRRWLPTAAARVRVRAACGVVVDKATLGQVFSEYFGFPCQSFHQFLHHHNHPGLAQQAYWWPQCQVDPIGLHPTLYQFKKRYIFVAKRTFEIQIQTLNLIQFLCYECTFLRPSEKLHGQLVDPDSHFGKRCFNQYMEIVI